MKKLVLFLLVALFSSMSIAADFRGYSVEELKGAQKVLTDKADKAVVGFVSSVGAVAGALSMYQSAAIGAELIASGAITGAVAMNPVGAAIGGAIVGGAVGYTVSNVLASNINQLTVSEELKLRTQQAKTAISKGNQVASSYIATKL